MITSGQQTITTTPTVVDGITASPCVIYIRNNESTKTLYLGNSNVSPSNGLALPKETTIEINLPAGEQMHMVTSDGSHSVSWLRIVQ